MSRKLEGVRGILVIRPGGMGDVILATPALSALRERFGSARIALMTNPAAAALFEGDPRLDEVLAFREECVESSREAQREELSMLGPVLRARGFELAVDLRGSGFSSRVALVSGARWRAGFHSLRRGALLGFRYNLRAGYPPPTAHRVELARAVVGAMGIEAGAAPEVHVAESERLWAEEFLRRAGVGGSRVMGIQPGASDSAKCWPVERFHEVANRATKEGAAVVVLGTANQPEANRLVALGGGRLISAVGGTTPRQLAALIRGCALFLGNDSGPMHLAGAVGTPVVAIFAATDPGRYGPVGGGHRVFRAPAGSEEVWEAVRPGLVSQHIMP